MEKVFPTEVPIFNVIIDTIVEFGEIFFLHPSDANYGEILHKLEKEYFRCLFINNEGVLVIEKPSILSEFISEISSQKRSGFILLLNNNHFNFESITNFVLIKTKTTWFYEIKKNDFKNLSTKKSLLIEI